MASPIFRLLSRTLGERVLDRHELPTMIRPRDALHLAETLCRGASETEWRCAVGRAYYAAFHQARYLLQVLGFQIPRAELVHAFLWKRLRSCGNSSVGTAGSKLQQLRSLRNRADYEVAFDFSKNDAIAAVETSRQILDALETLTLTDRQSALDVMTAYERDVLRETTWRARPR